MVIATRPLPLGGKVDPNLLPNQAVFLVGDIHGQWDALVRLLDAMSKTPTGGAQRVLVTLGDAIHKGPKSHRVLKAMLGDDLATRVGADGHVRLLGNHEILLARALMALEQGSDGKAWISAWAKIGGEALLSSWAKDRPGPWHERLTRWRDSFPSRDLGAIGSWSKSWSSGGIDAVHAGFSPGVDWAAMGPLNAYEDVEPRLRKHPHHWATVRGPFLDWTEGFQGRLVIHGHTPPRSLFSHPPRTPRAVANTFDASASLGRICLDGGAGYNVGVTGAVIHNGAAHLFFSPC